MPSLLSIILAVDIDGTRIKPGRVRTRVTEFYPGKSGFCLIRVQPGFVVRTRLIARQEYIIALHYNTTVLHFMMQVVILSLYLWRNPKISAEEAISLLMDYWGEPERAPW